MAIRSSAIDRTWIGHVLYRVDGSEELTQTRLSVRSWRGQDGCTFDTTLEGLPINVPCSNVEYAAPEMNERR